MILHDFIYEWDGKSRDGKKPITWFPGAYKVRIIKLADEKKGIYYLFPLAVLLKPVQKKNSGYQDLKNYIHNFAEKLSCAYDLDIRKTMWVEIRDSIRIAHLNTESQNRELTLFSYTWRKARPNEMEMISPFLKNF